jgi:predicted nuclease of predicted toxin-antitoxin system
MKLLLDSGISPKARDALILLIHDVIWMGDQLPDPGDEAILNKAHEEKRILVTLDKDFGELIIRLGLAHSGLIRLVDLRAAQQAPYCQLALERYGSELEQGAIVTVTLDRIRIRPPEEE